MRRNGGARAASRTAAYARVMRSLRTAMPAHLDSRRWPVTFAIPCVVKLTEIAARQRTDILAALRGEKPGQLRCPATVSRERVKLVFELQWQIWLRNKPCSSRHVSRWGA